MKKFKLTEEMNDLDIQRIIQKNNTADFYDDIICDCLDTENVYKRIFGSSEETNEKRVVKMIRDAGFVETEDTEYCEREFCLPNTMTSIIGYDPADRRVYFAPTMTVFYGNPQAISNENTFWYIYADPSDGGAYDISRLTPEKLTKLFKAYQERYDFLTDKIKQHQKEVEHAKIRME